MSDPNDPNDEQQPQPSEQPQEQPAEDGPLPDGSHMPSDDLFPGTGSSKE